MTARPPQDAPIRFIREIYDLLCVGEATALLMAESIPGATQREIDRALARMLSQREVLYQHTPGGTYWRLANPPVVRAL